MPRKLTSAALSILLTCWLCAPAAAQESAPPEALPIPAEAPMDNPIHWALGLIATGDLPQARRVLAEKADLEDREVAALLLDLLRTHEGSKEAWEHFAAAEAKIESERVTPEDLAPIIRQVRVLRDLEGEGAHSEALHLLLCHLRRLHRDDAPAPNEKPIGLYTEDMVVTEGLVVPEKAFGINPFYSEQARRDGIQGIVITQLVIDREGCTVKEKILKDLEPSLDENVGKAMRWSVWEPASLSGEPVSVYYNLTTNFALRWPEPTSKQ